MAQQRRTVLEPTGIITAATNDLEYLAVFDFFNYPKSAETMSLPHYAIPDPGNDWSASKMSHG